MIFKQDNHNKEIKSLNQGKIKSFQKVGLMATLIIMIIIFRLKSQGKKALGHDISFKLVASFKVPPVILVTINNERVLGLKNLKFILIKYLRMASLTAKVNMLTVMFLLP